MGKIINNMPKQETKPSGNQKKAVRDIEKELAKLAKKKKAFYKYASSKTKVRRGIFNLDKPDGTLTTSDKEKAET